MLICPCLQASGVELHWPTKLALSPLDGSLHIVDDSQVPEHPSHYGESV